MIVTQTQQSSSSSGRPLCPHAAMDGWPRRRLPAQRRHHVYPMQKTPRRRRRRRRHRTDADVRIDECLACDDAQVSASTCADGPASRRVVVDDKTSRRPLADHLIEPNDHDRCRRPRVAKSWLSSAMAVLIAVVLVAAAPASAASAALSASAFRSLESPPPLSAHQRVARSVASAASEAYRPLREQEICPSMDIRNNPKSLEELNGCRVVEGFVQIVLIGDATGKTPSDFGNHTYPMLREITGYLLFYRVHGLRSVGQLFPNLAVIRGQQLFFDFSLVVFELMQLQEMGLRSLTNIQRGSVFIERNPNLCYLDTIDWARIAYSGRLDMKIKGNKNPKDCYTVPPCPGHCPSGGGDGRRLCWNNDHCQKVCDKCDGGNGACRTVGHSTGVTSKEQLQQQPAARHPETECCHAECAGGCSGAHASQCDVCRNVIHEGECRSSCPPGFYLYMKRRCVKDFECVKMPPPREAVLERKDANWKFWGDECILECPAGYREQLVWYNNTMSYNTCVPCEGTCRKVCKAAFLNNIETVQKLRGCTAIDGSLEIQIKGGDNIVRELERSLADIVEIHGYVKIARSFPLVSLGFLRSLRNITGTPDNEYALIVQDNQNLQKLWPAGHKITINKKFQFHFNPQLCIGLIEDLFNESRPDKSGGPIKPADTDVSPYSNGDKAACAEEVLDVKVTIIREKMMVLTWNNFRAGLEDKRQLLGYIISYIEAPYQNVTYYDGRNACGGDGWVVDDVAANPSLAKANDTETHIITRLKPYTQYAIYVQTYTVASQHTGKRVGARSPIIYNRTLPGVPDPPEELRAIATSSSELVIDWEPPNTPNGIITYYMVEGVWAEDDQDYVDKQDSCADLSYLVETKKSDKEEAALTPADNRTSIFGNPGGIGPGGSGNGSATGSADDGKDGKCDCTADSKNKESLKEREREQQFHIDFENFLHNKIYVRNANPRAKRSVSAPDGASANSISVGGGGGDGANDDPTQPLNEFPNLNSTHEVGAPENRTNRFRGDRLVAFSQKVTGTTYTVTGLRHYAEYTIVVYACQDMVPNKRTQACSNTSALTSARTKQNDFADEIPAPVAVLELNHTASLAKIAWNEPADPNGLVIKYQIEIEYRRSDVANPKTKRECVRRKEYAESNKTLVLHDLNPGNYCVQVRAVSLSGPGPLSRATCFVIEEVRSTLGVAAIVGVLAVILVVILASAGAVSYYYRRKTNGIFSNNPDYHAYKPDGWEVERSDVELVRELGKGSFGMVYEGVLHKTVSGGAEMIKCAVKTVNERATVPERMQFLNEANVMKEFNAHHVVKLLGVVYKGQPTFVIMELMANGDLNSYLRSHRPNSDEYIDGRQPPTLKCVLKMAIEIADGMAYLADKKFVHRDLAARNCMVAEDLTVKIGDFGMTRDIYETDYYRKDGQGLLPVRWMAPESIRDGVFTSQSDVWSYGVVLWEMATLASRPYQGLANEQVLKYVMEGGVMERPEGCPDRLFNLMEMCWKYSAKHRPTFLDIIYNLLPEVPPTFASVSFYHSDAGVAARDALRAHHEHEIRLLNDPRTPLRGMIAECDEIELDPMPYNDPDSVVSARPVPVGYVAPDREQCDEERTPLRRPDDVDDEDGLEEPKASVAGRPASPAELDLVDGEEDVSKYDEATNDEDHVAVLYPYDRRAYILVKSPTGGNSANGAHGSKSDSSKAATTSVTSEDSKGSYVSNGSASNGYVMGILKQRRHNAEC